LCERLGISRVTLRKALTELVSSGLVNPSHGRGWFVTKPAATGDWPNALESFSETAHRKGLRASSIVLKAVVAPADLDQSDRLKVAAGTPLFTLDRIRLMDDIPIAVDHSVLPVALAPNLPEVDFGVSSLYEELARAGIALERAETSIESREADADVARQLGITLGKPTLVLDQVVYDHTDRPILSSSVHYSGERYRLRTTFTRTVD
jgi:DNA-binding GntR family transcriptional regulator